MITGTIDHGTFTSKVLEKIFIPSMHSISILHMYLSSFAYISKGTRKTNVFLWTLRASNSNFGSFSSSWISYFNLVISYNWFQPRLLLECCLVIIRVLFIDHYFSQVIIIVQVILVVIAHQLVCCNSFFRS